MADKDYAETLFQAMEVLIDKKIETVKFDETISAIITDASKASTGQYTVIANGASFIAYSTVTTYKKNDAVMVTIPQGNYQNQKMIIGKQVDSSDTPLVYKSPLETIVNLSNNLISGEHEIGYYANGRKKENYPWPIDVKEVNKVTFSDLNYASPPPEDNGSFNNWDPIWVWPATPLDELEPQEGENDYAFQGYSRLGISAQFSTWLDQYQTVTGNYGLVLEITFRYMDAAENASSTFKKYVSLDSEDFFGNVYGFETYYTQAQVYNIEEYKDYPIVGFRLFPYQRVNFKDINKQPIESVDDDNADFFSTVSPNIFIKDPFVCLGIAEEEFAGDFANIESLTSTTYYKDYFKKYKEEHDGSDTGINEEEEKSSRNTNNLKKIRLHWVHKDDDTDLIQLVENDNMPMGYEIRWYRFKLGASSADIYVGPHWQRLSGQWNQNGPNADGDWVDNIPDSSQKDIFTNMLEIDYHPNINLQTEKIKAVIVRRVDNESVDYFVCETNVLEFTNQDEIRNNASIVDQNCLAIKYEDNTAGNYFIYNRAGQISKEADKEVRKLTAVFSLETSVSVNERPEVRLSSGDWVRWTLTNSKDSMIKLVSVTDETVTEISSNNSGTITVEGQTTLDYCIKKNLSNKNNNNTITVEVFKDGQIYSASTQMRFGTAGTSGSDYTLILDWETGKNAVNLSSDINEGSLTGTVLLMDSSGEIIEIPEEANLTVEWAAFAGVNNNNATSLVVESGKFYPVENSVFSRLEAGIPNDTIYSFSLIQGEKYVYNLNTKNFEEYNGNDKIIYQKHDNVPKLEFSPVETVNDGENKGKIINNVYHYDDKKRLFVKYNNTFIIDPWDSYQEAETYYKPVLTKEKVYLNGNLTCSIDDNQLTITNNGASMNQLYILQITLSDFGDYDLVAKFPVPLKNGETKSGNTKNFIVDYIEGTTDVRYATTGEIDYAKNPYEIKVKGFIDNKWEECFGNDPASNENLSLTGYWKLLYDPDGSADNFLPVLTEQRGQNKFSSSNQQDQFTNLPTLTPPGVYFKDAPLYGVQFVRTVTDGNTTTETVLWTQPILVYQDNYPSTTLNKWNGKDILTDNDAGTITANGLSAGKKESDNTFTGVVLGDWSRTDTDKFITKQTGVYGFNHGAMSYALKDDGTAFFGKDGKGRIYFNGNKAQIYSAHWIANTQEKNGMLIDVDDGYIKMIGTNKTKITLSSNSSPYFQVQVLKQDQENSTNLIHIADNSYYLQSNNYSSASGSEAGVRFDLGNGKLTGYNFDIYAKYTGNIDQLPEYTSYSYDENTRTITTSTKRQYSNNINDVVPAIQISSQDNTYPLRIGKTAFTVTWTGVVTAKGGTFNDLTASGASITNAYISNLTAINGSFSGSIVNNNGTGLNAGNLITAGQINIKPGNTVIGTLGYVTTGLPDESGTGIGFSTSDELSAFKATSSNAGFKCGDSTYVSANYSSSSVSIGGTNIYLRGNVYIGDTPLSTYIQNIINSSGS